MESLFNFVHHKRLTHTLGGRFRMKSSRYLVLMLILALASCVTTSPEPEGVICADLAEIECLKSAACTLEYPPETDLQILCRLSANYCDSTFRQYDGTRAQCESKPGCQFFPAQCDCAPAIECDCSNFPPARCALAIADRDPAMWLDGQAE